MPKFTNFVKDFSCLLLSILPSALFMANAMNIINDKRRPEAKPSSDSPHAFFSQNRQLQLLPPEEKTLNSKHQLPR